MKGPAGLSAILFSAACAVACSSSNGSKDPTPPLPTTQSEGEPASARKADPREVVLSASVAGLLRRQHLSQQKINDELSLMSYDQFIETIDRGKLFFLKKDIDALAAHKSKFDDELLSGNLRIAHEANEAFLRRLPVVEKVVNAYLSGPIDLSVDEYRETDPDKLEFAASEEELAARWGRSLKLEILGRVHRMSTSTESRTKALKKANDGKTRSGEEAEAHAKKISTLEKALGKIPKEESARLAKAQEDVKKSYSARFTRLADVDPLTPAANFINAITGSFDPHTIYMPPTEKENFDISMTGSLIGIGAVLMEQDHFIGVNEIVVGGAAWKQGELEAGDLILSVTQGDADAEPVDIGDMKINRVVKMIRGKKGTTVTLTVQKEDKSIKTVSIVRDTVSIAETYARGAMIKGKGKSAVGYIHLPSFYGHTNRAAKPDDRFSARDVKKLLEIYEKRKVPGIILDLRQNGGGLLDDARKMAGFFIDKGPVVQTQLPDGTVEVLADTDPTINYTGKVVVLIDRFSASASEIVAAALQDYGRAVVVGAGPTHGKGTVQGLLNLDLANESEDDPPLGFLKLTLQQFFRINGASTQLRGVEPDIGFPDSWKHIETGERSLDHALPWREVDKLSYDMWGGKSWDVAALKAKSLTRQAESTYFTMAEKRGALMKKRRDESKIPLAQEKYKAYSKKQKDEFEALSPDEKDPKPLFALEMVDYAPKPTDPRAAKEEAAKNKNWTEALSYDPVVSESVQILRDML